MSTTTKDGVTVCCNEPPDRTIDPEQDCCPACGAEVTWWLPSDMPISALFEGTDGTPSSVLTLNRVRGGQPRPYANHEDVDEWRRWTCRYDGQWSQDSGRILMQEVEWRFARLPRKPDHTSMNTAFQPYLDLIEFTDASETVVRTMVVTPYCD